MNLKQIKIRYFVMYLAAFLIAFISSILIYMAASRNLEQDSIERFHVQYRQGLSEIEDMIGRMNLFAELVQQEQDFRELSAIKGAVGEENLMRLYRTRSLMHELRGLSEIPYAFVLFEGNNAFISNSHIDFEFANYYNNFLKIESSEYETDDPYMLKEALFTTMRNGEQYIPLDRVEYYSGSMWQTLDNAILYVIGGKVGSQSGSYVIGMIIDTQPLRDTIFGHDTGGGFFLNVTSRTAEKMLASYGEAETGKQEKKEDYYIITDTCMGFAVEAGISLKSVQGRLSTAYQILWIYLVFGLMVVLILTLVFSGRGYRGIAKVISELPKAEEEPACGNKGNGALRQMQNFWRDNEFKMVADLVKDHKARSDVWKEELEEIKSQNSIILLEHMFTSGINYREAKQVLLRYFEKEPEFYCVVIVRGLYRGEDVNESLLLDFIQLLKMHTENPFVHVRSGDMDELFLFSLNPSQESNTGRMEEVFHKCMAVMAEEASLHVGISAIGTDISNISRCYEQALQVVRSLYVNENMNMVRVFSYENISVSENLVNLDFLNRFNNSLLRGCKKEAMDMLENMQETLIKMPFLYEPQKEQIYYSVRNVFYNILLHFDKADNVKELLPAFRREIAVEEMITSFQVTAGKICDDIAGRKKSGNEKLQNEILHYIEENYADAALSSYQVSRKMNISEKYLQQLIKEYTGESFSGYLLEFRLNRAKEYLELTDYNIERIVEITGFTAVNTFYRNFSKKVGVSPGAYRDGKRAEKQIIKNGKTKILGGVKNEKPERKMRIGF